MTQTIKRRDRLTCLPRKTHAFAKTAATWDAAVGQDTGGLGLSEHNWLRPHQVLRQPTDEPGRRDRRHTPAMVLDLTDHPWTWPEFLTTHVPVTP